MTKTLFTLAAMISALSVASANVEEKAQAQEMNKKAEDAAQDAAKAEAEQGAEAAK